jgi:hypothetical protein
VAPLEEPRPAAAAAALGSRKTAGSQLTAAAAAATLASAIVGRAAVVARLAIHASCADRLAERAARRREAAPRALSTQKAQCERTVGVARAVERVQAAATTCVRRPVRAARAAVVAMRRRRCLESPGLSHSAREAGAWRWGAGPMPGAARVVEDRVESSLVCSESRD